MNQLDMAKTVEQFIRNDHLVEGQDKVVRVADSKTVYVETVDEIGRSIVFNEYKVDGKPVGQVTVPAVTPCFQPGRPTIGDSLGKS